MLRWTFWQSQYSDGGFTAEGCCKKTNKHELCITLDQVRLVETPWAQADEIVIASSPRAGRVLFLPTEFVLIAFKSLELHLGWFFFLILTDERRSVALGM